LPSAGGSKILVDPPPDLELKGIVVAELEMPHRWLPLMI